MYLLASFHDPGPHGVYRYSKNMLPEVRESEFRKGSQVTLILPLSSSQIVDISNEWAGRLESIVIRMLFLLQIIYFILNIKIYFPKCIDL